MINQKEVLDMKKLRKLNTNTSNTLHMSALCHCSNTEQCNCGMVAPEDFVRAFNDTDSAKTHTNEGK